MNRRVLVVGVIVALLLCTAIAIGHSIAAAIVAGFGAANVSFFWWMASRRRPLAAVQIESSLPHGVAETALRNTSNSILITDASGTICWVNPRFTIDSGYSADEAIGENPRFLSAGRHTPEFYQRLWRTLSAGETWRGRFSNRRKSGTLYTEDATIIPVPGKDGAMAYYVAIKTDVTERIRTESDLADQRLIFSSFLTLSVDAVVFIVPSTGEFVQFNEAASQHLGYTSEEFSSLRLSDLLIGPEAKNTESLLQEIMSSPGKSVELSLLTRDGKVRVVNFRGRAVRVRERSLLSATWSDITETKQREADLEQALNTLAEAQRIARLGSWQADFDAQQLKLSSECCRILGVQECDRIDFNTLFSRIATDDLDRFQREFRGAHTSGDAISIELRLVVPGSSVKHVHVRGERIARTGERIGSAVGTIQDVTEKKNLENEFMRAQRLESIGMLSAGIAHDLNNVLAPILMAAPILRMRSTAPGDQNLLQTLEKSAERGASLVKQILAFANGFGNESQLMQVKHILRDVASIVQETFPKHIQCITDIPGDLWPIVGQPTQLHQVLLNLCVNARDAMPDGGQLIIAAANASFDSAAAARIPQARPGDWLQLTIEDNGTGIAPEVLDRMWESFFTTKEHGKGTGLGLATVRRIVDEHHGFIQVQTQLGRGSKFRIFLPADQDGVGEETTRVTQHPFQGQGELLLIVDDEVTILEMAQVILTDSNYRTLVAHDGAEALAIYSKHSAEIGLVITDLNMPMLGGGALAHVLRHMTPEVKLIAMSGLDANSREAQMHPEEFADAFLSKPFRPETLLNLVHHVLRGGKTASKRAESHSASNSFR